jgi:GntR family transcriptional regulator
VAPLRSPGAPAAAPPIPLYYQIVSVLESRIHSGVSEPGTLLSTEKELAREFGVSRITVQKALDALHRKGLVDRHRARGTFVAPNVRPRGLAELHGFLDDIMLMGVMGETSFADRAEVPAPPEVAAHLRLAPETRVVRLRRAGLLQSVRRTWVVNYLPLDIGAQIDEASLYSATVIRLIDQLPNCRLAGGRQTIGARAADPEAAHYLEVEPGDPILLLERELETESGRIVDHGHFFYVGRTQAVRISRAGR